ncbi:SDR family NAD(P)-dependent oxidoreductase [Olivibacter sitiensis]|uniref:SDR family NAD(P)-dependent oxidoreductase n=1 Tax=Olivibacter sitiensis TaxID=376470 RepID=UPI0004287040|nr:SDR family NAD(P)-dependent oxidoreductase [Olivibacter sitiensis]
MDESREKYALITGATKGIGRAIAYRLAQAGYHLLLIARSEANLTEYQKELQAAYSTINVMIYPCDLSIESDLRECAVSIDANCPQIDVLINNVGLFHAGSILDIPLAEMKVLFDINYFVAQYLSAFFGNKMAKVGSGHIINIGSIAAEQATEHASAYSVTKFALHGLTVNLRAALAPKGIKVSEVIPGATWTSSWEGSDLPREKFVTADDVARAVVACLSVGETANVEEVVVKPFYR